MKEILKANGTYVLLGRNERIKRESATELRATNEDTFWRIRSDSPITVERYDEADYEGQ